MKLPCVVSEILAEVAEGEAAKLGVPMSIAVVDSEGGLQLFKRMDGTLPASTELAVSKAFTAAVLRMPTHQVGELSQPGQPLYGIQHTHHGRIILFGGGYPLRVQGQVVGGIGISGGSVEEDMQVAQPAVALLETMERWAEEMRPLVPHVGGSGPALSTAKEKLVKAFRGLGEEITDHAVAALTGGVLLALD
jgi:uncharacterized protein GlcG (DUF336 family)